MSTFGDSQVRNLVVDNTATSTVLGTATVEMAAGGSLAPGPFRIKSTAYGKDRYSAIIDPKMVLSSGAKALVVKKEVHTVALTGAAPTVGEGVELVVYLDSFGAHNTVDATSVRGWYKIQNGDDVAAVAVGLADSLSKGLASTAINGIVVDDTTAGSVIITLDRSDFKLGKFDGKMNQGRVLYKGNESEVTGVDTITKDASGVVNGVEIANLEWFTAGNIGDVYRGVGYPNNFDADLVADITKDYELYEIAFYSERISAPGDKQRQMFTIASADLTMIAANLATVLA